MPNNPPRAECVSPRERGSGLESCRDATRQTGLGLPSRETRILNKQSKLPPALCPKSPFFVVERGHENESDRITRTHFTEYISIRKNG